MYERPIINENFDEEALIAEVNERIRRFFALQRESNARLPSSLTVDVTLSSAHAGPDARYYRLGIYRPEVYAIRNAKKRAKAKRDFYRSMSGAQSAV